MYRKVCLSLDYPFKFNWNKNEWNSFNAQCATVQKRETQFFVLSFMSNIIFGAWTIFYSNRTWILDLLDFGFFFSSFRSQKVMTVAICKLIPLNSFTKTKRNKTSLLSSRFCIKPAEETSKIELFLCVLSPEEQVTFWKVINRWLHCYRVQCMYIWYDCAMQTNCSYIFT